MIHKCNINNNSPNAPRKFLYRGLIILGLVWIIGVGALIYVGETTYWATSETTAALPSIEIVP